MKRVGGHQLHMWLVGAAIVVALLLGSSLGWALALAAVACGAMLVVVFWIGRSSAQQHPTEANAQDFGLSGRRGDRRTSIEP